MNRPRRIRRAARLVSVLTGAALWGLCLALGGCARRPVGPPGYYGPEPGYGYPYVLYGRPGPPYLFPSQSERSEREERETRRREHYEQHERHEDHGDHGDHGDHEDHERRQRDGRHHERHDPHAPWGTHDGSIDPGQREDRVSPMRGGDAHRYPSSIEPGH